MPHQKAARSNGSDKGAGGERNLTTVCEPDYACNTLGLQGVTIHRKVCLMDTSQRKQEAEAEVLDISLEVYDGESPMPLAVACCCCSCCSCCCVVSA